MTKPSQGEKVVKDMMKDHIVKWHAHVKSTLASEPARWGRLLSDFIDPATTHHKGNGKGNSQPLAIQDTRGLKFSRYFVFYNWQYRSLTPVSVAEVDEWFDSDIVDCKREDVRYFHSKEWQIDEKAFRYTWMEHKDKVDWDRWYKSPSSMVVPGILPAVGGLLQNSWTQEERRRWYLRKPTVINFPAFVWMMGGQYTGKDIIDAWKQLPIINEGKANRGDRRSSW